MEYKKLLIQQQTYNGSTYTNVGQVVDTQTAFHVVCQEFPFKYLPETKDLPKRDWYDEDGEDVYIPTDGLRFKAYEMEVKFLYVGSQDQMKNELKSFIDFICGKNTSGSPLLAVYDEYTQTGRRGVYVTEVGNELLTYDDSNGKYVNGSFVSDVIGVFKVKFRVTDPVYSVQYSNGALS